MSSNKLEKLLHLVGWFIWTERWCTDLQTLNFKRISSGLSEMDPVQYSSSGTMIALHNAKWGKCSQCSGTGLCSLAKNCCTNRIVWKGAFGDSKFTCVIWGSDGIDCEQYCSLRFDTVLFDILVYMCVLEESGTFILMVEENLKMKAESSADTLVPVYQSQYYHIPEDSNI